MAEWTKATVLKTVVLRTPVNESLDLKEATSNEGAFLVSGLEEHHATFHYRGIDDCGFSQESG